MESFLRVAAISNKIDIMDPMSTAKQIIAKINEVKKNNPDIIFLPSLATTGVNLGNLSVNKTVKRKCFESISYIVDATKKLNCFIVIGGYLADNCENSPMMFVAHEGQIEAALKCDELDCVFSVRDITFNILAKNVLESFNYTEKIKQIGTDVTLLACDNFAISGSIDENKTQLKVLSKITNNGIMVCNIGAGDTSFPNINKGFVGAFECGEMLSFKSSYSNECHTIIDFDSDIIRANKNKSNIQADHIHAEYDITPSANNDIMRLLSKTPYLPSDETEKDKYLQDLFSLQATSLMTRVKNIACENLVIGVSGGLDSTLALLVAAKAMDMLELPRKNITAITMQGFGTTGSTYNNAIELMQKLGCTVKEIPIKESILKHFEDIGHDVNIHDVTYENSQARERTQILLDYANKINAIVVGTGDLSEEALGFCTFSGDHIANYNVNTCVTKTVIRELIAYLIRVDAFAKIGKILDDILNTPISPELLPPDSDDKIIQKTEEILGPYLLHDFFLYYFIMYNFSPSKIFVYAKKAFAGEFDENYIKEKLKIFFKRLIMSQFKRSCTPDSAIVDKMNLANKNFYIPSDGNPKIFIQEIDSLK